MQELITIWMGNFKNEEEFMQYTNIKYNDDGDSIASEFEREFMLGYYDRDLVEKKYIEETSDVEKLLKDFSYYETFQLSNLNIEKKYNCIIIDLHGKS